MVIKSVASAVCLISAATALAQVEEIPEWVLIGTSTLGSDLYVRPSDVRGFDPQSPLRAIWVKLDHSRNKTVKFRSATQRYVIDCSQGTYQEAEGVGYMPNGISENLDGDFAVRLVVPDTVIARIVEAACLNFEVEQTDPAFEPAQ